MNFIDNHINLISLIGTIVGILGLFISIATLIQTSNIKNALNQEKFKIKYNLLFNNISRLKEQLNNDDINDRTFIDIIKNLEE